VQFRLGFSERERETEREKERERDSVFPIAKTIKTALSSLSLFSFSLSYFLYFFLQALQFFTSFLKPPPRQGGAKEDVSERNKKIFFILVSSLRFSLDYRVFSKEFYKNFVTFR